MYYSFGKTDIEMIVDRPNDISAASDAHIVGASLAFFVIRTSVLMSVDDGVAAPKKAGSLSGTYKPPA